MFKLRLIQTGKADEVVTVEGDEAVIGRAPECDLVIAQPHVSKRHLKILRGLVVVDLGSRNGTFTGGRRVREATVVSAGRVSLGDDDAVVEVLLPDGEETVAALPGESKDELARRVASLERELEGARAQVAELRRLAAGDGDALPETTRIDRGRVELESRLRSQAREIERLRDELDQERHK